MFDVIEIRERAAKLAALDVSMAADDDLLALAVGCEQVASLVQITQAHALAELEQRGVTDRDFGHTTKTWLAGEAGISPGAAGDRVRKANQIRRRLPKTDAAVTDGRLSFEHAKALATTVNPRVEAALADVEDQVIALAGQVPFTAWYHHVRRLIGLLDHDGPTPATDPATNQLRFAATLDGTTRLDGSMTTDVAAIIRTAIETRADQLYKQHTNDHQIDPSLEVPSWATLRMLALADLIAGTTTRRAEITLLLHDDQLTDLDGHPITEAAAGVYGCDPDLWAVIVDHMGIPLDLGHTRRFASYAQRRAIEHRDGGCAFPGCDQPMRRCDIHHLTSPLAGGTTNLNTMIALCRHHHTTTHHPNWTVTITPNGTATWTNPHGTTLTPPPPSAPQAVDPPGDTQRPATPPPATGPPPSRAGPTASEP